MFSFLSAVWAWASESASLLLDLANAGRVADNTLAVVIAAVSAVLRIAALLVFMVPGFLWLKNFIWVTEEHERRGVTVEKTRVRTFVIVLLIASIVFEVVVSLTRKG